MSENQQSLVSLSKDLRYDLMKQLSASAYARRVVIDSENGPSFTLQGSNTQDIFFSVDSSANSYINSHQSYFMADIYAGGTGDQRLSGGLGSAVIRTLQCECQGQILEDIQRYNVLSSMLYDVSVSENNRNQIQSVLQHSSEVTARQGLVLPTTQSTASKVCFPLISAIVGSGADRMFPIFAQIG